MSVLHYETHNTFVGTDVRGGGNLPPTRKSLKFSVYFVLTTFQNSKMYSSNDTRLNVIPSTLKKLSEFYPLPKLFSTPPLNYHVFKYEMLILKKHVKFGRIIKSDLFKVCSIFCYTFFPSFGQFVNTTKVKIFPFCREAIFYVFVRTKALFNKCVNHRCKQVVIERTQVW